MIKTFWQRMCHNSKLNNRVTKLWFKKIDDKKLFSVQKGTEGILDEHR